MLRAPILFMSRRRGIQTLALKTPLLRRLARRFVAGETLDEAMAAVRTLRRAGITATLDHLGESVTDTAGAQEAASAYIAALKRIAEEDLDCSISLKLSQMGLGISPRLCRDNLAAVLQTARRYNNFVRIDMESHQYVDATLSLYRELRGDGFDNLGVVIQAYLYRSQADTEALLEQEASVRLVKGAYDEPSSVAYPSKRDVDASFRRLAALLLSAGNAPAIATHDERLLLWTERYVAERGIEPSSFEFEMLYGVRRDLQERLARRGYRMRVYIPYGSDWYAYLMRRLAERPANLFFLLSNLFRG